MAGIADIFVDLSLDTSAFSKGLKNATGQAKGFSNSLAGALSGKALAGFASLTAGALSFTTVMNGARSALDKFGDIADRAASAGLDPEFFQGIAHGARLAGVDMQSLSGALDTFNKNVGLASEGKGKLVSQLEALNPELLKSIQLSTNQADRLRAVAEALKLETDASRQAALATAAFGGEGVKLTAVFRDGAAAIDEMVRKAKEIGITVDRSLIARADELGDRLDTANEIISSKMNQGFISLAPLLADAAQKFADMASATGLVYENFFKPIGERINLNPLQNELAATYEKMQPIKEWLDDLRAQLAADGGENWRVSFDISEAEKQLAALTGKANQLLQRIQELQGYTPPAAPAAPTDPLAGMLGRGGPGRIKPPERFYPPGGYTPDTSAFGGVVASIEPLDLGLGKITESMTKMNDIGETLGDTLAGSFSGFADAVLSGVAPLQALGDELGNLGKQLLNSAISNFGSLFTGGFGGGGGVFGGGWGGNNPMAGTNLLNVGSFDGGGYTGGGARSGGLDGKGGFLAMMHPQETVIDHTKGGGAGGGTVNNFYIDAKGAEIGVEKKIVQAIQGMVPGMIDSRAPAAVARSQRDRSI